VAERDPNYGLKKAFLDFYMSRRESAPTKPVPKPTALEPSVIDASASPYDCYWRTAYERQRILAPSLRSGVAGTVDNGFGNAAVQLYEPLPRA
jgi:hypothetical protein